MKKIAIFNVGGASSAYIEVDEVRIIIDIGAGNGFSPVNDFFIPLAQKRNYEKDPASNNRYWIDQLLLTHLDSDHISDFPEFDKHFIPKLFTTPNDHQSIHENLRIDRDKIPDNEVVQTILTIMRQRTPGRNMFNPDYEKPLCSYDENIFSLFYIPPKHCELLDESSEDEYSSYCNNISLVSLVNINGYNTLFTGDIMNDGIEYLINNNIELKNKLTNEGIDFLVVPHHGLQTSFPTYLFETIKNKKVKLNIISEKYAQKEDSENRSNVDSRYSSPDFSDGYKIINGLKDFQYSIMTSNTLNTHIVINFDSSIPTVKRCTTEELLKEFI